jgi:hypothetical protein
MNVLLVWLALLQTSNGNILQIDNIVSQADCERIVGRFEYANRMMYYDEKKRGAGTCTQYNKYIPIPIKVDAPIVNVETAPPVIKNNIIVEGVK